MSCHSINGVLASCAQAIAPMALNDAELQRSTEAPIEEDDGYELEAGADHSDSDPQVRVAWFAVK